jgi:hypothetical protein
MDIVKIYDDYPGRTNFVFTGRKDPYLLAKDDDHLPDEEDDGWFSFPNPEQGRIECKSDKDMDENSPPTYNIKKILENQNGILYKDPGSPNGDFQDIEITWRVKNVTSKNGDGQKPHLELVAGGFKQANEKTKVGKDKDVIAQCEAMSYHANIYPGTGRVKFEKDSRHDHHNEKSGYAKDIQGVEKIDTKLKFDDSKEIVQKFILYRIPGNEKWKFFMKLELWHDETGKGDNFKKVHEFTDKGQWGKTKDGNGDCCNSDDEYEFVVLWMTRCAVGIRCDNLDDLLFKDWSVRSIDPSKPLHQG